MTVIPHCPSSANGGLAFLAEEHQRRRCVWLIDLPMAPASLGLGTLDAKSARHLRFHIVCRAAGATNIPMHIPLCSPWQPSVFERRAIAIPMSRGFYAPA
jgi:hypothetical protein